MGTRVPPPEASVEDRSGGESFFITRRGSVEYIATTCGPYAYTIYSYLLQCANFKTGQCNPSQRTISLKLKMARNTVSAALSALVTEGIIEAKYSEQPKYTSTRWVLKDIGTKARRALREVPTEVVVPEYGTGEVAQEMSHPTSEVAHQMSQGVSQKTLEVAHQMSRGGSPDEPKIEEGNRRRERDSLSSSSSKTHRESAVVQDLTKSGSGEPPASFQKPPVPREERLRRAEFVVAALYGDIKGVPGSTWGFVNKQLGALEWPPEEDLDGFVKWWRSEFPTIKLTLGAISPKNWPAYLAHKANSAPKYIPRTWQGD